MSTAPESTDGIRRLSLAERYGFTPKVCRPYRAQTKGKVERFNHYLKNSFVVPLAASLNQVNLVLDVEGANSRIGPWLMEIANARIHMQCFKPMTNPLYGFFR
ncbi:transposase [Pseudomonas sp. PvP025]|nr:transposase [Pseudomonas sp. PvP025]MDQ0398396.1 transposase [Pseudomonas sp. PvP006]